MGYCKEMIVKGLNIQSYMEPNAELHKNSNRGFTLLYILTTMCITCDSLDYCPLIEQTKNNRFCLVTINNRLTID